jgi:hypothetical protein
MSLQCYFVGPDDSDTCDGCDDAVNGNPYTIDDCPEPGEFECGSRCRHMQQVDGDNDGQAMDYDNSAGFVPVVAGAVAEDEAAASEKRDQDERREDGLAPLGDPLAIVPPTLEDFFNPDTGTLDMTPQELANAVMDGSIDSLAAVDEFVPAFVLAGAQEILDEGSNDAGANAEPTGTLDELIDAGSVEEIVKQLRYPDTLDYAFSLATNGFDDHDPAFTLAEALTNATGDTYKAKLNADDGRWYVQSE